MIIESFQIVSMARKHTNRCNLILLNSHYVPTVLQFVANTLMIHNGSKFSLSRWSLKIMVSQRKANSLVQPY